MPRSGPLSLSALEANVSRSIVGTAEAAADEFQQTVDALRTIMDKKLYKPSYSDAETYARRKWGISKQYLFRLVR